MVNIDKCIDELSNISIGPVENLPGFSSPKTRRLLSSIGQGIENLSYLEIGVHRGSTFIPVAFNNIKRLVSAYAIDNWSEFEDGTAEKEFFNNLSRFGLSPHPKVHIFRYDCFDIHLDAIREKINFFLYDGNHAKESQKKAYTYFNPVFADEFITVVDDWNWEFVREGTREAFSELKYELLYERELFTPGNGHVESWWNGLFIAVIRKQI